MENKTINSLLNGEKLPLDQLNSILPIELKPHSESCVNKHDNSIQNKLTKREIEITYLIIDGLKNKKIAEHLNLSYETVKTHRKNIFRKLQVQNATELFLKTL